MPLIGMTEDMVAAGPAASLARPGGNITGSACSRPNSMASGRIPNGGGAWRAAPGGLANSNVTPLRHLETLKDASCRRGVELCFWRF